MSAVRRRSEDRLEVLRAIEPDARRATERGSRYPQLTLHLGLAYHQAIVDVCAEFEHRSPS